MDCLRSGREEAAEAPGVDVALGGLSDVAEGGPPKKSKPSNESPGFCCLGGAAVAFGRGGRVVGGSVVLGRAGGVGTSPNRSTFGVGCDICGPA